jgi:hypothetical protein
MWTGSPHTKTWVGRDEKYDVLIFTVTSITCRQPPPPQIVVSFRWASGVRSHTHKKKLLFWFWFPARKLVRCCSFYYKITHIHTVNNSNKRKARKQREEVLLVARLSVSQLGKPKEE